MDDGKTPAAPPDAQDLAARLQRGAKALEARFLGKEEVIRLLFVSVLPIMYLNIRRMPKEAA